MKGIILAGGKGSRLFPVTIALSKQLLPVFDKPMIYYPISLLMLSNITEVLVISTPHAIDQYKELLGNGSQFGIDISYKIQDKPGGLAQAFLIAEDFIGNDSSCLVLGDNILYGHGLTDILEQASTINEGALIFGYQVENPESYGIVEFERNLNVLSIEEKPEKPKSNYAVPGLYFYDKNAADFVKTLKPSPRGELEITDLNRIYMTKDKLKVELLGRGFAWFDTGSPSRLLNASQFIEAIQTRQGLYIACLEEIAYKKGFITRDKLEEAGNRQANSEYGQYILKLVDESVYPSV